MYTNILAAPFLAALIHSNIQIGAYMEAMSVSAVHTSAPAKATRINWGSYLAGIGVLSWIVFVVVNNPIGITTAISQVSGGVASLVLAIVFGFAFGWLLHRGRVADYNIIVRQFLFKDFTVLKVMLTAIIVGGIGVFVLVQLGYAKFHIKPSDLLAITLGAGLFGIGKVQLPQLLGVDAPVVFAALGLFVIAFFVIVERR